MRYAREVARNSSRRDFPTLRKSDVSFTQRESLLPQCGGEISVERRCAISKIDLVQQHCVYEGDTLDRIVIVSIIPCNGTFQCADQR